MPSRTRKKLEAELSELSETPHALGGEAGAQLFREILAGSDPRLIASAAKLIAQQQLQRFAPLLAGAYRALAELRPQSDPGCHAKEALLVALETLEHAEAELFAEAAVYVQYERSKQTERDTGARVRARGVLGLARLGHEDALPIFGACLGDREPLLRLAAAQAIAHRGQRDGAGLLLLRLGAGDELPELAIECLRGLFAIAPDHALRYAQRSLRTGTDAQRDQTLHALGSANDERAIELLSTELEQASLAPAREQVIAALGLSRRSSARERLLSLVREGRPSDASAALSALAIHRYDPRLREQLEAATAHSRELTQKLRMLDSKLDAAGV
jgi:hypothetical protein